MGGTLRPRTVNIEVNTLSAIFREAIKRGFVDRNPVKGVRKLPEENIIIRYLSADEEKSLLAACAPTLVPVVMLALHTGMRLGELLHLEWKDIDFEQRLIRVKLTKSHRTRYLPMNARAVETLKGLPRRPDIGLVFWNPKSGRHWTWTHAPGWHKAIEASGVKEFRFQDLRHTFASRLVQAGVPIKVVQELLGHANVATTMRYAHLAPADLRRAVDILAPSEEKPAAVPKVPESKNDD
jgi:integrase